MYSGFQENGGMVSNNTLSPRQQLGEGKKKKKKQIPWNQKNATERETEHRTQKK